MNHATDSILGCLRCDTFVSGEALSKQLGITRAAVWKQVETLRNAGVSIEAAPRLGYKLTALPDKLFPALLQPMLHSRALGHDIRYYDEVDSTNNVGKALAQQGCAAGTVIIAEAQTSGRGRLERAWSAPHGAGVWISFILRPPIEPAQMPRITLIAALAVHDAIKRTCAIDAGIKWPNDVLIGSRKCCGILVDMGGHWERLDYAVLGIGINVRKTAIPSGLEHQATALDVETGAALSRLAVCAALIDALDARMAQWHGSGDFAPQLKDYCSRSITLGKSVRILSGGNTVTGVVEAFDDLGMIRLRLEDGSMQRIASGDVSLREA